MSTTDDTGSGAKRVVTGVIVGYLRSKARYYPNVALVRITTGGVRGDNLVGRRVVVVDRYGNRYVGRIVGRHGSKGDVVKVRFKPNIPGQLVNSMVTIE